VVSLFATCFMTMVFDFISKNGRQRRIGGGGVK
jgi:hypothetical protein